MTIDASTIERGMRDVESESPEALSVLTELWESFEGRQVYDGHILSFEETLSTEKVVSNARAERLFLASPLETLAFGILYPEFVESFVIPYPAWTPEACCHFIFLLQRTDSNLVFHALQSKGPWGTACKFLALRWRA